MVLILIKMLTWVDEHKGIKEKNQFYLNRFQKNLNICATECGNKNPHSPDKNMVIKIICTELV